MRVVATLVWMLWFCAGCSETLPVAPVSGIVTLGGKPLADATITTQPIAIESRNPGPGSFGRTDDEGRFELELVRPAIRGAIIGEHRVMISPPDDAAGEAPRPANDEVERWEDDPRGHLRSGASNWPTRFTDGTLRLEVPQDGRDDARFDLTP